MNTDELIDELIRILKDENYQINDNFIREFEESGIFIENGKYFPEYKIIPQVYEKIRNMQDKKQVIFSALKECKEKPETIRSYLASIIFMCSPLTFLSKEEIEKILISGQIKEIGIDEKFYDDCIVELIKITGKIEEYLTTEKIKKTGSVTICDTFFIARS